MSPHERMLVMQEIEMELTGLVEKICKLVEENHGRLDRGYLEGLEVRVASVVEAIRAEREARG